MSLKELQLPSIASLRAIAALRSPHLALVRPARIGLGFESAGGNQKSLAEVEDALGGPGRLSLPYSLRWLLDVLTGLGVLHRSISFVHGEVQPEHIVLGEDGVGRLVPVVRAHWVRGEQRTPERLYYLAPEKLLGDKVDVRSDVFSVGVMLWEALSGQRLLEATEVDDIIARFMGGGIPRPQVPEGEAWTAPLVGIAERAIAIDPGRRFTTVAEMKAALEGACSRYLASAPGMAELFQDPERRARNHVRESLPPQSQRATVPPVHGQPVIEPPTESQKLDMAAERLARSSLASIQVEDELTTKPKASTAPPKPAKAPPKPSLTPVARKGNHVNTLLGVPPPVIPMRGAAPGSSPYAASSPHDDVTSVYSGPPPASEAPTVIQNISAMNLTAPVGTPAPVIAPRAPAPDPVPRSVVPAYVAPPPAPLPRPPPPEEHPPPSSQAFGARGASLSPYVAPQPAPANVPEPSFELVRPRKRRGALWLVLGAAAAIGLFAARPWLARQVAAATGALPDTVTPTNNDAATPSVPATTPGNASDTDSAAPATSDAPPTAVGIASTPAVPSERAPRGRFAAPDEHVVIHDTVEPNPLIPQPAEPKREPKPEPKPAAEPPPAPAPPPPTPPAPKPKAAPVSDADRYGI